MLSSGACRVPLVRYSRMTIVTLADLDRAQLDRLEQLTFEAARDHSPEWLPTPAAAREEIEDAFGPHQTSRVVLAADGAPLAWIAASPSWGRVWELHPLLVAVTAQRRGLGRRLVDAIERHAAAAGALTMWVGTSDTTGATSLSNVDLYADPLRALATIEARAPHPFQFWQRVGYRIV